MLHCTISISVSSEACLQVMAPPCLTAGRTLIIRPFVRTEISVSGGLRPFCDRKIKTHHDPSCKIPETSKIGCINMLSQQEMDDFMEGEAAPAEPVDSNVKRRKLSEPAQTGADAIDRQPDGRDAT
jgi:hypothetical protein